MGPLLAQSGVRKTSAARVGSISAQSALHLWFYAHVLRCGAESVGIAGINYHYVGKPTDDSSLQGLPRQHHRPRLCLQASVTERPIALPPGKASVPCRNHTSYLLPSHRVGLHHADSLPVLQSGGAFNSSLAPPGAKCRAAHL